MSDIRDNADESIAEEIGKLAIETAVKGMAKGAIAPVKVKETGLKRGFFDKPKKNEPLMSKEDMEFLERVYNDAPNDVLELIISLMSSREKAGGGFNIFRLVSKRFKRLAESCTTKVFYNDAKDALDISSFPTLFERTKRLKLLSCSNLGLNRLDGLPPSLHELHLSGPKVSSLKTLPQTCPLLTQFLISCGTSLCDISPLGQCSHLKHIFLMNTVLVTDLSFLVHLPHLQHLLLAITHPELESKLCDENLTPIGSCSNLQMLGLCNQKHITNLSFISNCNKLQDIAISCCDNLSDISSICLCPDLKKLDITQSSVMDLSPLRDLNKLTKLTAYRMLKGFSVKDLSHCEGLSQLYLTDDTEGVEEVKEKLGERLKICYDHDRP